MATFTANSVKTGLPVEIKELHSGLQAQTVAWTISTTATLSSIVKLVRVPNGTTIVDWMFHGAGQDIGQTAVIGFSDSPSALMAAYSLTNGATRSVLDSAGGLLPYVNSMSDDANPLFRWVQLKYVAGSMSGTHTGKFTLFFQNDGS